jgi:excisionase family DNA binding protein
MGRIVPTRATSLDSQAVHISVREAAHVLGVCERSVYSYLEKGRLSRVRIEGMTMLIEDEVLSFERQVSDHGRGRQPLWHSAQGQNPLSLTTIIVSILPGCDALLDEKLTEFCVQGKHHIAGASTCAISRTLHAPNRLMILLFWSDKQRVPDQQREQEIAALLADLSEVCACETAAITEGQALVALN